MADEKDLYWSKGLQEIFLSSGGGFAVRGLKNDRRERRALKLRNGGTT